MKRLLAIALGVAVPDPRYIYYHGAEPPSIPGHDGPVISIGDDPTILIACGYVNYSPEVFHFVGIVADEKQSWTAVKALFD